MNACNRYELIKSFAIVYESAYELRDSIDDNDDKLKNITMIDDSIDSFGNPKLAFSHVLKKYPHITCESTITISNSNRPIGVTLFLPELERYYRLDEIIKACSNATLKGAPCNFLINSAHDLVLRMSYYSSNDSFSVNEVFMVLSDALNSIEDLYLPEMEHVHQIEYANKVSSDKQKQGFINSLIKTFFK